MPSCVPHSALPVAQTSAGRSKAVNGIVWEKSALDGVAYAYWNASLPGASLTGGKAVWTSMAIASKASSWPAGIVCDGS